MRYVADRWILSGRIWNPLPMCGSDIPTIIFHNRLDFCCPVYQAWDLKQALPNARLEIIADYGHGSKKQFNLMKQEVNKFLACYQHNK